MILGIWQYIIALLLQWRRGLLLWLCIAIGFGYAAFAQITPVVQAQIIRDFARISFQWPQEVKLRTGMRGNELQITFEQPAIIDVAHILKKLAPYVTHIQQTANNKTIILALNKPYRVRSFVSGNTNGVDIIGLQATADNNVNGNQQEKATSTTTIKNNTKQTAPANKTTRKFKTNKEANHTGSTHFQQPPMPKTKPNVAVKQNTGSTQVEGLAKIKPKSKPKSAPKTTHTQTQVADNKNATGLDNKHTGEENSSALTHKNQINKSEISADTNIQPETDKEKTNESAAEKPITNSKSQNKAEPVSHDIATNKQHNNNQEIVVTINEQEGDIVLSFAWDSRVAVAALRRGRHNLLLFGDNQPIDISALQQHPAIKQPQALVLEDAVLLVFYTDYDGMIVEREDGKYIWNFRLTKDSALPTYAIRTQTKTEPPLKPHLFMPVLQSTAAVKLRDPIIGDEITIIPLYRAGEGVYPRRNFVEFSLLATAQGVAIKPNIEGLRVARLRNGLKITKPKTGIVLSEDLPPLSVAGQSSSIAAEGDILFPYDMWKPPEDIDKYKFEHKLLNDSARSGAAEKAAARLRLAQLYLADGKSYEAIGLLDLLKRENADFYNRRKLVALHAAANFLAHRLVEARHNFSDPSLDDNIEIKLWRDSLDILFTGQGNGYFLDYYDNFIGKYPPALQRRLALIAADFWINLGRHNNALKIFDILHKAGLIDPIKNHVDLLIAKIAAASKRHEEAIKMWDKLSELENDRFVRVRAKFAKTTHLLAEGEISIEQAIKELDMLRIQWRGDQFELNLLLLLGELYETTEQYREALRAYREIVTYFPKYPGNIELTARMSAIFIDLFNNGGADNMEPLDALALYYEFRDLTPVGKDGDIMIRNLADRLASIDLLDRAAALLEHQVRFRTSGEERSRIGARLALLHLLNRNPQQALKVLEVTGYGRNPEKLQQTRALLTARALSELGEPDRALALLQDNDALEAKILALNIYWNKKQWPEVINVAEEILSQRNDPSQEITDIEGDILLKLALAYIFQGQDEQVQYLRDYFLPLMTNNPKRELFDFVTQDAPVNPRNLAQLTKHISAIESFLASYKNKIQEQGLSAAVQ